MATPVGHYLLGLSVSQAFARNDRERMLTPLLAMAAVAPDLDVIPGIFVGNLWEFHRDYTHSVIVAAVLSVAVAAVLLRIRPRREALYFSGAFFVVYCSHMLLDILAGNPRVPDGVPLLWPFSDTSFYATWFLMLEGLDVEPRVWTVHNLLVVVKELMVFIPLNGLIWTIKKPSAVGARHGLWIYGGWFLIAAWVSVASVAR